MVNLNTLRELGTGVNMSQLYVLGMQPDMAGENGHFRWVSHLQMVDVPLLSRFTRVQEIASIWPEEITRFPFELSTSYLLVGHRWPKGRVGKFHLQTT